MTPGDVLLRALAQFLREEVQPALDGAAAYQARIARNLLAMLEREAQLAPRLQALDRAAAERLQLDPREPAQSLARALRDGEEFDQNALMAYLRERTLLQLAIDNPRYSSFAVARERWPEAAARLADDED